MKRNKFNLRIPGPTPLPPSVIKAISQQMINHRGHSYEEIHARVIKNLQYFFQTKNDIFLLTSSGMGGLEAAIVNFFSPEDFIIAFTCGEFGNRWFEIAKRFGARIIQVKFPNGEAVDKNQVKKTLEKYKRIAGILVTHNETSTGVLNNIENISYLVKKHPARPLFLVDSISGLGAVDLPMDKWGVDVLVTASQKAWMAPPGISMIAVSSYAWQKHQEAKMPRYYFDLTMYKKFSEKNQTPATCAVSTIFGLNASLALMRTEGRQHIFRRHLRLMKKLRKGIKKIGLELLVKDEVASPTVTSIKVPIGIDAKNWLSLLKEKYKLILAGGMSEMKGKIIRVAHMGYVNEQDIDDTIIAIKQSLREINK